MWRIGARCLFLSLVVFCAGEKKIIVLKSLSKWLFAVNINDQSDVIDQTKWYSRSMHEYQKALEKTFSRIFIYLTFINVSKMRIQSMEHYIIFIFLKCI